MPKTSPPLDLERNILQRVDPVRRRSLRRVERRATRGEGNEAGEDMGRGEDVTGGEWEVAWIIVGLNCWQAMEIPPWQQQRRGFCPK